MRRDKGPPAVGRQMRSVMAKVNQSHLFLATVFLVLGTVVHDASTATMNKDLEAFIQKSSRMIAAPFPLDTGASTTDAPPPTTPTTAPPASSTAAPPSPTTAPPTSPTTPLPSDKIWEEIKLQLNNITKTLDDLKGFVDDVPTPTTAQPTPATESTTAQPTPTAEPTTAQPTPTAEPTTAQPTPTAESTTAQPTPTAESTAAHLAPETGKIPPKARRMIPPLYFVGKLAFGKFRVEADEICTSDTAGLCEGLKDVLNDVDKISNKIEETDEATMGNLDYVRETAANLTDVSQGIHDDESFVRDHMNVEAFDNRMDEVKEGVDAAIDDIDDKLSPEDDNTLAIVLGTIFGILGVALIIGGIVMYRKKKNKRKQGTNINMERKVGPSSTHSSNSGE